MVTVAVYEINILFQYRKNYLLITRRKTVNCLVE